MLMRSHPPVASQSLPDGTVLAKPISPWGCWATVTTFHNTPLKAPRNCSARARGRCLTCHAHRAREAEARALQAKLEGEDD